MCPPRRRGALLQRQHDIERLCGIVGVGNNGGRQWRRAMLIVARHLRADASHHRWPVDLGDQLRGLFAAKEKVVEGISERVRRLATDQSGERHPLGSCCARGIDVAAVAGDLRRAIGSNQDGRHHHQKFVGGIDRRRQQPNRTSRRDLRARGDGDLPGRYRRREQSRNDVDAIGGGLVENP